MKRLVIFLITLCLSLSLIGCAGFGNNNYVGFGTFTYRYAYVKLGDTYVEYEVDTWKDFDNSDMIEVKFKDGSVILTHSNNVILSKNKLDLN